MDHIHELSPKRPCIGLFGVAIYIAFIMCVIEPSIAAEKSYYEGAQLLLVPSQSEHLFKKYLERGDAEVWCRVRSNLHLFVTARAVNKVHHILGKHNVTYEVANENVQRSINNEKNVTRSGGRAGGHFRLNWNEYHDLQNIYDFMESIVRNYPERAEMVELGRSVEGRPLKMLHIRSNELNSKVVWIDGGMHAREWISTAVVTWIAKKLVVEGTDRRSWEWTKYHNLFVTEFYVLPVANPDGYHYTHDGQHRLWRKNKATHTVRGEPCMGVDLNRNFDYRFEKSDVCDSTYPGPISFSEPETQAIADFLVRRKEQVQGLISFHAYGNVVLHPYGYNRRNPQDNYQKVKTVGRKMAKALSACNNQTYITQPIKEFAQMETFGSLVDWAMAWGIQYPYAIELRPGTTGKDWTEGFTLPPDQIIPTAKEALEALTVLVDEIQ